MIADLKFALCMLVKAPGFTAIAILTLALGIGASTAIFSVLDSVLLRPLPYPAQEHLVEARELSEASQGMSFAQANFNDLRDRSRSFEAIALYAGGPEPVAGGTEPVRTNVCMASADFFRVLGVTPMIGRVFGGEREQVAVVSYGFWKRILEGRTNLERPSLRFLNRTFTVIGVLPLQTEFPRGVDVWFPNEIMPSYESRTAHNFRVIARLRDRISFAQANNEVGAIGRALKAENGPQTDAASFALLPFRERSVRDFRSVLFILCGAVGLLLAIACSNVANLLLVRASSRRKEVALRAALGASRGQLARQFIVEALMLALAAGAIGALLASWSVRFIVDLYHGDLPHVGDIGVSPGVLLFTLTISLVISVVLGLVPVIHASRRQLQDDLTNRAHGSSASHTRARHLLVVTQVALTLMLLAGAGLLGRSLQRLLAVDPGFRTESVIAMTVLLPYEQETSAMPALGLFHHRLLERIESLPGVTSVGGTSAVPMSGNGANGTFMEHHGGNPPATMHELIQQTNALSPNERSRDADYRAVSAGYFVVMGIPLIRGRLFQGSDGPDAPHVALVSQLLAQRYWPNEDPIGKQIQFGNMDRDLRLLTIVGIVGNVRDKGFDREPRPTVYTNYFQRPAATSEFSIVVRARGDVASLTSAMRREARALNPEMPTKFETIAQVVAASFDNRRFSMIMLGVFAGTALLLATVGLYGIMAFVTAERTTEIGIRMALGAQRYDMLRLMIGQGMRFVGIGVLVGLIGVFACSRLLQSLLFGVGATDLATMFIATVTLAAVAFFACCIPARRAMRVDPMEALRYE